MKRQIAFWLFVIVTLIAITFLPIACSTPTKEDGTVDTVKQCQQEITAMQIALAVSGTAAKTLFGMNDPVSAGLLASAQKALAAAKGECAGGNMSGFDAALLAFNEALANLSSLGIAMPDAPTIAQVGEPPDFRKSAAMLEGRALQAEHGN